MKTLVQHVNENQNINENWRDDVKEKSVKSFANILKDLSDSEIVSFVNKVNESVKKLGGKKGLEAFYK